MTRNTKHNDIILDSNTIDIEQKKYNLLNNSVMSFLHEN
jgi:hypothetical protein